MAAIRDIFIPVAATMRTDNTRSDLSQFAGRYEVNPVRAENVVLDIRLESDNLWLKPSHAARRKLLLTDETRVSPMFILIFNSRPSKIAKEG
jgi:hypothetical protein